MVSVKCWDESKRVVAKTSAMRPLKRSIMPLVWEVLGLIKRCSM